MRDLFIVFLLMLKSIDGPMASGYIRSAQGQLEMRYWVLIAEMDLVAITPSTEGWPPALKGVRVECQIKNWPLSVVKD